MLPVASHERVATEHYGQESLLWGPGKGAPWAILPIARQENWVPLLTGNKELRPERPPRERDSLALDSHSADNIYTASLNESNAYF